MWRLPWHLSPALVTVGCVLSMDAVITESESMFDARLLGAWEEVGGSDRAVVSTAGDGTYAIEYTTDGSVGRFEARLGRLGDRLVLHGNPRELRSALGAYLAGGRGMDESILWRRRETTGLATQPVEIPCFESAAWREADDLFRGDGYWMGADVASTVDLGGDRILWLFGDTWIDPSGAGTRQGARMVSNSVAIQTDGAPSRPPSRSTGAGPRTESPTRSSRTEEVNRSGSATGCGWRTGSCSSFPGSSGGPGAALASNRWVGRP